jgi:hypothetical protein
MPVTSSVYVYMENLNPQCFVGVDALTYTTRTGLGAVAINAILLDYMEQYPDLEKKAFTFQGAKGFSMGSMRYAARRDRFGRLEWAILMMTGNEAGNLLRFRELDLKPTRVDLRVDVVLRECVPDLPEKLFAVRKDESDGRLIKSLTGMTYYPTEKRGATYYGRIYDKSPEYGRDLGFVFRFEVEVKREAAASLVDNMLVSRNDGEMEQYIQDTTFGIFWDKWRVPSPKPGIKPVINYVSGSISSPEKKLEWLRRNVAPTVKYLSRMGYNDELMELFKLDQQE